MHRLTVLVVVLAALLSGRAESQEGIRYYGASGAYRPLSAAAVSVANTGTAEELLYTMTIPAGMLRVGDSFNFFISATPVNNANAKSFRLRLTNIAGTLLSGSACSTGTANNCAAQYSFVRVSATEAHVFGQFNSGNGTSSQGPLGIVVTPDFTAPIVIIITGLTPTAANDLVLKFVATSFVAGS